MAFEGFLTDGYVFAPSRPICRLVADAHAAVTGGPARHYPATGLTDARHYVLYGGTQAVCYGPEADAIYGIDESVGLDSMRDVTRVLALVLAQWCGVERAG